LVGRLPVWLRKRFPASGDVAGTRKLLKDLNLRTVCQGAVCPNQGECFARRTATFMILGDTCTRDCAFCAVPGGIPCQPDGEEPLRVAEAVHRLGLRHVVVTSVTRDDLPDGGAAHFAATIRAIREMVPEAVVEVLTPDFGGCREAVGVVVEAAPAVFNHNLETVPRLYPVVRPGADYRRSLAVLHQVKTEAPGIYTKSGLMVGLGETFAEVEQVMGDLREVGCDIITIGQYLQPSARHLPVTEYVHPQVFDQYRQRAAAMGFLHVAAGPFVRSSYHADDFRPPVR